MVFPLYYNEQILLILYEQLYIDFKDSFGVIVHRKDAKSAKVVFSRK